MQSLYFQPDDTLFFKDGRPMMGATSGKGDHFPMPHVMHSALLAALHRAKANGNAYGHEHRYRNRGKPPKSETEPNRSFGALTQAGPFPLLLEGDHPRICFPKPADLLEKNTHPTLLPLHSPVGQSSLAQSLKPVVNGKPPSKEATTATWLDDEGWQAYLENRESSKGFWKNTDFFQTEPTIGIGIDPESGTTCEGQIYSASHLRFKDQCRLVSFAELPHSHKEGDRPDELARLFEEPAPFILGGENRTCSVEARPVSEISLPIGPVIEGTRVKFVLLTPTIFPHLGESEGKESAVDTGGWLPNWVAWDENYDAYRVKLKPPVLRQTSESREKWRQRVKAASPVQASLVAAITPRPIVITGWSLGDDPDEADRKRGGAKSTLLAVPAGAVYYFEADSPSEAQALADVLNWHGKHQSGEPRRIRNRRSTLMGEKGYGLGVCAPWNPYESIHL